MKRMLIVPVAALALSGCWTFSTTEYPVVQLAQSPAGTNLTVAVTGFAAVQTYYRNVLTYDTVYVPGCYGRYGCRPGYLATVPSSHLVAEGVPTDAFLMRAKDAFERAGYSIGAASPELTVDVEFGGPVLESGDKAAEVAWMLCTVFFCDYDAVAWTAKLRIRDNHTGRLVFHNDYVQRYETKVFGLIPLFGIASCSETTPEYMQSWCLSALTDRAVADATSFLSALR